MENYTITCVYCHSPLQANTSMIGTMQSCYSCNKKFIVPDPSGRCSCPLCAEEINPAAKKCKHCGEFFEKKQAKESAEVQAEIIVSKSTTSDLSGCLVIILGLILAYLFFPFGIIPGLIFFIWGIRLSSFLACSRCSTKLTSKTAKICPGCGAQFK